MQLSVGNLLQQVQVFRPPYHGMLLISSFNKKYIHGLFNLAYHGYYLLLSKKVTQELVNLINIHHFKLVGDSLHLENKVRGPKWWITCLEQPPSYGCENPLQLQGWSLLFPNPSSKSRAPRYLLSLMKMEKK